MSHEIEADFKYDWEAVATQCKNCTSFQIKDGAGYCTEAGGSVPSTAHCDFFQAID